MTRKLTGLTCDHSPRELVRKAVGRTPPTSWREVSRAAIPPYDPHPSRAPAPGQLQTALAPSFPKSMRPRIDVLTLLSKNQPELRPRRRFRRGAYYKYSPDRSLQRRQWHAASKRRPPADVGARRWALTFKVFVNDGGIPAASTVYSGEVGKILFRPPPGLVRHRSSVPCVSRMSYWTPDASRPEGAGACGFAAFETLPGAGNH